MILEPLRVRRQRADLVGLLVVGVVDDAFPGALHAARVHVDLDEAVHRVHVRIAILHPRDVERLAIAVEARLVKRDERLQRLRERLRRERNRVAEVPDDSPDLAIVEAADLVDLFDELAVALDEPRVELVLFLEALEVGHRDAVVQVVGARREDVLILAGRLARHHRLEVGIEEHPRVLLDALGDGLAVLEIEPRAVDRGDLHRFDHALAIEIEQELARGQVVVRARCSARTAWCSASAPPASLRGCRPECAGSARAGGGCRGYGDGAGRNRCRGRRARPDTDARRASSP